MRFALATIACLAALLAGAAVGGAERAAPLPPPGSFAISYLRSGGIAFSTSRLVVRPGRRAVAETGGSRAGENRVSFQIPRGRVLALERGLRRAGFGQIADPGPTTCADCFEYEIGYRGHRLSIDESQMPDRLGEVVGELESIVTARAIPPNARAAG
jgi:hypothetical protein